jgi:hypothetical protein
MSSEIRKEEVVENEVPRVLHAPIEDVESLERYCLDGYHPILVGYRLNDRYQIVHKLGFGTYSTIWLSWDEKSSHSLHQDWSSRSGVLR